jgi:hypothetical protein
MIGIVVPPSQGGESSPWVALVAVLAVGAVLVAVALTGWFRARAQARETRIAAPERRVLPEAA